MNLQLFSSGTILARKWKFFAQKEDSTPKSFIQISGVTKFTISRSKEDMDTTDFDNDGYDSHIVAGRAFSLKVEGHMRNAENGCRCPGQVRVEQIAEKFGVASIQNFHIIDPAGNYYQMKGSVKLADIGGGNKDKTSWGFEVTGEGKMQKVSDAYQDTCVYTWSDVDKESDDEIPDILDISPSPSH